ncbi:MAG: phosphoenolpyruvate--protein phosphotransferase [Desulfovibrio sp.]|nr:MAG: phosphoenolpyruvate--protein phosphotransferase [Desulfovibrio sp.]
MAARILQGIAVSAGVSVGKAFFLNRRRFDLIPRQTVAQDLAPFEEERLRLAFELTQADMAAARDKVPAELKEHAAIINTHLAICKDPKLLNKALKTVREMGITAEWALEKAVDEIGEAFSAIEDPYIRERYQDVQVVADRIQSRLMGQGKIGDIKAIRNRAVLLAHDLTPADTIGIEVSKIMSLATEMGGKTSHTGILARSLQIPALVGVTDLEEHVMDGQLVIIDGLKGRLIVDPDEEELAYYSDLKYQFEDYQASIIRDCSLPGETLDGYRVEVLANIELFEEVTAALDSGAEGVGLYRTEYSFLNRRELPSEEELFEEYSEMASIMHPRTVVFRTLDVGGDKILKDWNLPGEPNPALGLRAIRFCLKHRDLFIRQLRAILRASEFGNIAVMFPMISGLKEVREAKALWQRARQELRAEGRRIAQDIPLGIMVELPSAVMIAESLAREVDFFSIGTNDLIQYSLGIDRTNKHVSYLYQPLHPSVVRSIKQVVDAAHQVGIEVAVCGEVASDPYCVPILMGMQVDALSIAPQAIPGIKRVIRQTTMDECKGLLKHVLESDTVGAINRHVKDAIFKRSPEELTFYSSILDMDEG